MIRFVLLFLAALCGQAFAGSPIPSGALVVNGNQIQTATGQNVRLSCADYTPGTPATDIPLIRAAGFDCVKVGWFDKTLSLTSLDTVVSAATANSMRVLFVHLGNEASAACGSAQKNGVWYDKNDAAAPNNTTNNTDGCGNAGTILYSTFKANWQSIATRYAGNQTVAGFILHHEPTVAGTGLTTPVNWGGGGGTGGALTPRQRVLQYLQGQSGNHTLIGQTSFPDEREFNGYAPAVGVSPAIMFNDPWLFECGEGCFDTSWTNSQIAQWNAGALVGISALFPNPVNGGSDRGGGVDPVQVINPATAQGARYKGYLDQIANNVCLPYKALGIGMIFRFGFEFDLGQFWWDTLFLGSTGYQNWYRYTHDYLVNTRGCDNMLFVYAANGGPESNSLITSAYPGDAYVDIVGVDAYTGDFAGTYGPIYDILRALAPSKLVAFTEAGADNPTTPQPNYNLSNFRTDVRSRMPRIVYANWWSGWQASQYLNANTVLNDTTFSVNKATVNLPPAGGGGGGAAAGNGSDALAMCNDIGGALTAADSAALIICEGPVNSGTLFGGQANTTVIGDLTLAQTKPVVGTSTGGASRNPLNTFPFTSQSVWNVGIGSGAVWSSNSDADAITLHSLHGQVQTNNFGAPIFFGQASDPLVTVTGANFSGPSGSVSASMHVPANAQPSNDTDAAMSLVDSTQPTVAFTGSNNCVLTQSPLVNGAQINCGIGNIYNPLGDGVVDQADFNNGVPNGVNDFGQYPGIITDYDLAQGVINHAIRHSMSTNVLAQPASGQACVGIPWPNFCVDGGFNQYTGNIQAGLTIGIPASVNINTLGLSTGGLMLAKALQQYGTIWRDSGGTSAINVYSTPENVGSPLIAGMVNDWPLIIPKLQILRNQSGPGSGGRGVAGTFNGGGTYPTPAATACAQSGATFAQSNCAGGSGNLIPANKVAYAVDEFPQNVGGRNPDSSTSWITLSNTAYGYLVKNNVAPVIIADMGASLDGSNGALADDQGWASTIMAYLNGTATNGPVFGTCAQPMGMSWRLWQSTPAGNPNGILDPAGNLKAGQQAVWSNLQFTPSCTGGGGTATTWNPNDKTATVTLTNNNKTATTSTTAPQGVRSTTSQSTGKVCWDVQMLTSTTDWTVGIANGTFSFVAAGSGGLGSDANGAGYYPISPAGAFYYSGAPLFQGGPADVSGAVITTCEDFGAKLVWVSTPAMVGAGTPWNGLAIGSANPATGIGGASVSGLACPCFVAANDLEGGGVFVLNTSASLNVAIPSGFSPWDTSVAPSVGHPILINLGANDNLRGHANDNIAVSLNMESAR